MHLLKYNNNNNNSGPPCQGQVLARATWITGVRPRLLWASLPFPHRLGSARPLTLARHHWRLILQGFEENIFFAVSKSSRPGCILKMNLKYYWRLYQNHFSLWLPSCGLNWILPVAKWHKLSFGFWIRLSADETTATSSLKSLVRRDYDLQTANAGNCHCLEVSRV
jgi:hypothetical protein